MPITTDLVTPSPRHPVTPSSCPFVALQQQVFEKPHERRQALIAPVPAGIELGNGEANDALRPSSVDKAENLLAGQAGGEWMWYRGEEGGIKTISIKHG